MTALLRKPHLRYAAPFAVFMVLTEAQRFFEGNALFIFYGVKTAVTALLLVILFRKHEDEITGRADWKAAAAGLAVFVIWILAGSWRMPPDAGGFDPAAAGSGIGFLAAVIIRTAGAALLVPVMEELFWRSFLMRYLIRPDFLKISPGTYTHFSFWGTVFLFMLAHRSWEWPQTVLAGIVYGGYLVKTGNLRGCILAHAVTNFCLAVYVVLTGSWGYW